MASVTGPTSFSVTNPFDTQVIYTFSGVGYNGMNAGSGFYVNYRTSTDGVNWGSFVAGVNYTSSYVSSGSLPIITPSVAYGTYVQYWIYHAGWVSNKFYSGPDKYITTRRISPTPVGAPTACSVNATVSEGNVTLSWSGAYNGTANAISGYEIQYSESSNGSSWGGWAHYTTVSSGATSGSLAVSPSGTRGNFRRFQVRTLTPNASYNSGWKVSTNSVRRNTLPGAPTTFSASPTQYTTENITLSWSGAVTGTSAIKYHIIQKAESTDNVNWGAWTAVQTITSSATSGSLVVSPTRTLDRYTLYRICIQDTLDCLSGYKNSNSVYSLALPFAPTIAVPKASAPTYCRNPKILIQTVAPPGGYAQRVYVKGTDGVTYNSVDHPGRFSVSGTSTGAIKTVFTNPDTGPGAFTASVHCATAYTGPAVSRAFSVAASPLSGTILPETPVKAAHISTLQSAVNVARNYYGLSAYAWTHTVTAGTTNISHWPYQVKELRAAIQGIVDLLAQYGGAPKITWLAMGRGRPRADVMNQLQTVIMSL